MAAGAAMRYRRHTRLRRLREENRQLTEDCAFWRRAAAREAGYEVDEFEEQPRSGVFLWGMVAGVAVMTLLAATR